MQRNCSESWQHLLAPTRLAPDDVPRSCIRLSFLLTRIPKSKHTSLSPLHNISLSILHSGSTAMASKIKPRPSSLSTMVTATQKVNGSSFRCSSMRPTWSSMVLTRDGGITGRCSRTEHLSTVSLATASSPCSVNGLAMVGKFSLSWKPANCIFKVSFPTSLVVF